MKTTQSPSLAVQQLNIIRHLIKEEEIFPNNNLLPLVIYKGALLSTDPDLIQDVFESNSWTNAWRDGILDYHHYHSKAHEVLGVFRGIARIQFGGSHGIVQQIEPGDVVMIPAGVAHKFVEGDKDFKVVGAYPDGQQYDILEGKPGERPEADANIKKLPLPQHDPVYGSDGPLLKNWE
jgi:uncharacterized protein YjlB